jgi:hypothetical protein
LLDITDTGKVFEWRVTGETGGNVAFGIPTKKTKYRYELPSSQIIKKVREEWIATGLALTGDVTLVTAEELEAMTNQVEHDGVTYDIVEKIDNTTYNGTYYLYILRKDLG